MNTLERRRLVRDRVIDAAVAKAAVNESRRQRVAAAKDLHKAMTKNQFAHRKLDSVSYPQVG
jgi:hypothetical protein